MASRQNEDWIGAGKKTTRFNAVKYFTWYFYKLKIDIQGQNKLLKLDKDLAEAWKSEVNL